jgi:hypothetical protein
MTKLLKNCKKIILGLSEVIQDFKAYKGGKIK